MILILVLALILVLVLSLALILILILILVLVLLIVVVRTTIVVATRRVPLVGTPMRSPASASALALVHVVHGVVSFVKRNSGVAWIVW